jgi:L-rhamnose mutarotase
MKIIQLSILLVALLLSIVACSPAPQKEEVVTKTKRYCMALDLKNDSTLIKEYIEQHKAVWPEIIAGIKEVGISDMQIYRIGTRMFMIIDVPEDFDFETQMAKLGTLPRQAEWEEFMWKYQEPLPYATKGEKWMPMEKIFQLK